MYLFDLLVDSELCLYKSSCSGLCTTYYTVKGFLQSWLKFLRGIMTCGQYRCFIIIVVKDDWNSRCLKNIIVDSSTKDVNTFNRFKHRSVQSSDGSRNIDWVKRKRGEVKLYPLQIYTNISKLNNSEEERRSWSIRRIERNPNRQLHSEVSLWEIKHHHLKGDIAGGTVRDCHGLLDR